MPRAGQDERTGMHFIAFDDDVAYLFDCSCDSFLLAFSEKYHYADEMKEALKARDVQRIAEIIKRCEREVKSIDAYQKFISELDEHAKASISNFELLSVRSAFEKVEEVVQ